MSRVVLFLATLPSYGRLVSLCIFSTRWHEQTDTSSGFKKAGNKSLSILVLWLCRQGCAQPSRAEGDKAYTYLLRPPIRPIHALGSPKKFRHCYGYLPDAPAVETHSQIRQIVTFLSLSHSQGKKEEG